MPSNNLTAELISRLGPKLAEVSMRSLGGRPIYPWDEVAAAAAGLQRGPLGLVYAAYGHDAAARKTAIAELDSELWARGRTAKWRGFYPHLCTRLAEMAIDSVISPDMCGGCSGRGHRYLRGGLLDACPVCGGHAFRQADDAELARR